MHPRKSIRLAFRDRLKSTDEAGAFRTMAKDTVIASRVAPVTDEDYPAILIYSREEKNYSESIDVEDGWRKSTLMLVVQGMIRALVDIDDKLDDIAEQIETAIDGWTIPGHESATVELIESDIDVVTEGVRKPIGAIGLTYSITYRSSRAAPDDGPEITDVDRILWGDAAPVARKGVR